MKNNLIEKIVYEISKNTSLTQKTTQRLLNNLIKDQDIFNNFIKNLDTLKTQVSMCCICNYYKIDKKCIICSDESRDQNIICVVSNQLNVDNIEKNNQYKGLYHVLDSEINLNKNVSPNDIDFESLFKRLSKSKELILALNATFEGELTANYIYHETKKLNINVTRIAKGIPMGGSLDYMDESTLIDAFKNRKKYEV
ncbi:recombination mediator RecR [Mesoplasma corruscae]|uniref:Recombination protein RecR n=1 Tax=Mesoplasma corruscae TaxID=216874 RepID=A0A2S5RHB2_9MOLU|nr:recombination mediator RecR [Mesoplasma corruscae]PPE06677.1 recombination protein RecR [Mesoplasma corruscae]